MNAKEIDIEKMNIEDLEEVKKAAKNVLSCCSRESSKVNMKSFIDAIDARLRKLASEIL